MRKDISSVRIVRLNSLLAQSGLRRRGCPIPTGILIREVGYGGETKKEEASIRLLQRDIRFFKDHFSLEIVYDRRRKGYVLQ